MNLADERAAFETWIKSSEFRYYSVQWSTGLNDYANENVRRFWISWQARAIHTEKRITVIKLLNGGTLVRDDLDDGWVFQDRGMRRYLDEFETEFVDSALAASPKTLTP